MALRFGKKWPPLKVVDFGETGKPIALHFGEKWAP